MSRYVAPAKRAQKLAADQIISLSPDNFPEFLSTPLASSKATSPLPSSKSFRDCFKVVEKDDATHKSYPGGISPAVRAKMIEDGWEFLSLNVTKIPGYCERWNTKMAFVSPKEDSWFGEVTQDTVYPEYDNEGDDASYMSDYTSVKEDYMSESDM
jgi:hypothetical protein